MSKYSEEDDVLYKLKIFYNSETSKIAFSNPADDDPSKMLVIPIKELIGVSVQTVISRLEAHAKKKNLSVFKHLKMFVETFL